jgi:hypothetical protein
MKIFGTNVAFRDIIAGTICLVWIGALVAALFTDTTAVLTAATPVMLTVAGFLFYRRNGDEKKEEKAA